MAEAELETRPPTAQPTPDPSATPEPPKPDTSENNANGLETIPEEEQRESRRPKATAFKQQRLPAWQPILTAGTVLPTFYIIGIIFIPLGVGLLITSDNVREIQLDYTQCEMNNYTQGNATVSPNLSCADYVKNVSNLGTYCNCTVTFTLDKDFDGQVYMYYGLTNYFQNHRRYVRSRDDYQLVGQKTNSISQLAAYCEPYRETIPPGSNDSLPVAPCGAIANSLFNDTFALTYLGESNQMNTEVKLKYKGISWSTDKGTKFNNPGDNPDNLTAAFENTYHPPNWHKFVYELDPDDSDNNGYENEDFIVWMRTAALPNFRKLYRKVDHESGTVFAHGLPGGIYQLDVQYAYPVANFEGTKRIILSTSSWLGGKNIFLGVAYIVTGSLCIIFGCLFLCIHLKHGRRQGGDVNALG